VKASFIMFLSTLALLTAVKTDLAGRHYSQSVLDQPAVLSTSASDPLLFEHVTFYSNKNLQQALQQLRVMDNRVCMLVPLGDSYLSERKGNELRSARLSEFMLMIADKDFSIDTGRMTASYTTPGILALKDLAVEALTQRQYSIVDHGRTFRVVLEPDAGAVMQLEWQEKDNPALVGRECWNQIFRAVDAGELRRSIGRT
jgi:hypothetical protein